MFLEGFQCSKKTKKKKKREREEERKERKDSLFSIKWKLDLVDNEAFHLSLVR